MIQDLLDLALGANRVLTYAGYVLLAGTFDLLVRGVAGRSEESSSGPARTGRNDSDDHWDACRSGHSDDLRKPAARRHRHPPWRRRPAGETRCPGGRDVLPSGIISCAVVGWRRILALRWCW
jgi:hypothetical protein